MVPDAIIYLCIELPYQLIRSLIPSEYHYYYDRITVFIISSPLWYMCLTSFYSLGQILYRINYRQKIKKLISPKRGTLRVEYEEVYDNDEQNRSVFDGVDLDRPSQVNVYITDTMYLIDNEGGGRCQPLNGGERDVYYSDRDCVLCWTSLGSKERRIYHSQGMECYSCFSKRRLERRITILLLLRSMIELPLDIIHFIYQTYLCTQIEKMFLLSSNNRKHLEFPPSEYHSLFSHFPTLQIPVFSERDNMFQFSITASVYHSFELHLEKTEKGFRLLHIYSNPDSENLLSRENEYILPSLQRVFSLIVRMEQNILRRQKL